MPTGIFLVLSFVAPKGITGTTLMIYLVTVAVASLCGVFSIITMLLGMKTVNERVVYTNEN